jgi:hypothetical protein
MAKNADKCASLRQARQQTKWRTYKGFRTKMANNADVCSALFRSHALAAEQKRAKRPIFVPRCSTCTRADWNKDRQKRPFLFRLVPSECTKAVTNIADFEVFIYLKADRIKFKK